MQVLRSNMEIGWYWYKKGTNNKWPYDLTDHLIIDFETIFALASHDIYCRLRRLRVTSGGWKSLQWVMNIKVLHYTYGMGSLLFKSIFSYLCYWLYMNANPFTYTYCHLYFYHWNWRYVSQLYKNTCKNWGFLEYVTNACNSWYFNEKCTPVNLPIQHDFMEELLQCTLPYFNSYCTW